MFRIPVIWAEVLSWGQFLLCKYFFIADKDGKFVSISNRYNIFMWLMKHIPKPYCMVHKHTCS